MMDHGYLENGRGNRVSKYNIIRQYMKLSGLTSRIHHEI
jgi:hypothetical protein